MAASQEPQSSSSFSFTQGFLLGQLSVALLIFAFIKFFIFGDPPPAEQRENARSQLRQQRALSHTHRRTGSSTFAALRHKRSSVLRQPAQTLNTATILAKTYYNVSGHQPESLDWFNVLIAQTIAQLRADARQDDAILGTLQGAFNGTQKPDWLDEIRVTEVNMGEEFPIFSNCRIIPVDEGTGALDGLGAGLRRQIRIGDGTRLQARMDVDLSDVITLGIETRLVLNYPKPFSAVLPVALAVSVVRFSGTLSLSFVPSISPDSQPAATTSSSMAPTPTADTTPQHPYHPPTSLTFTFLPDYRLDLSVRSLLGSRARLTDVPKIAQLVEDRIHAWVDERVVEPRFQQIVLPSLWPRKKTARGPEDDADDDNDVAVDDSGEESEEARETGMAANGRGRNGNRAGGEVRHAQQDGSLKAKMEQEGQTLRDADRRERRRSKERASGVQIPSQVPAATPGDGMRRRDHEHNGSIQAMRMPGALPA